MNDKIRVLFEETCKMLGRRTATKWYDVGAWDISLLNGKYRVVEIKNSKGVVEPYTEFMGEGDFAAFLQGLITLYNNRDKTLESLYNNWYNHYKRKMEQGHGR